MSDWLNKFKKNDPAGRANDNSGGGDDDTPRPEEQDFWMFHIGDPHWGEIHIGLLATFGIKEGDEGSSGFRDDIMSLADRFNQMNTSGRDVIYSRKGE